MAKFFVLLLVILAISYSLQSPTDTDDKAGKSDKPGKDVKAEKANKVGKGDTGGKNKKVDKDDEGEKDERGGKDVKAEKANKVGKGDTGGKNKKVDKDDEGEKDERGGKDEAAGKEGKAGKGTKSEKCENDENNDDNENAGENNTNPTRKHSQASRWRMLRARCIRQSGIDQKETRKAIMKNTIVDDPKYKCYLKCMFTASKYMTASGEPVADRFKKHISRFIKDKEKTCEILEKCVKKTDTPCITAYNIKKCLLEEGISKI